jgi:predicted amidohydrolase YtcJ
MKFAPKLLSALLVAQCALVFAKGNADTIFYGGPILTVNAKNEEAQALAIQNGKIVAVGTKDAVTKNWQANGTQVIDLKGHTLMPGFVEPHAHIIGTTMMTNLWVNLSNFTLPYDTIESITQKLKTELKNVPPGGWLAAFGVDPSRTTPFMAELTAVDLDKVSTEVPILVLNQSGHIAYANHKALQMAGITERVELGKITSLKEVQDEMYGIIKGGAKVIGAIDPEVSSSFQASVAVAGNSVFQYAAKKIHELNIEGLKYQATQLIENSPKNISLIIQSTLDPVALKEKIGLEERRVSDMLYTTRDPAFHEKGMIEFKKNVAEAKVAVLSDYLSSTEFNKTESETLALMRQNNVGKYSAIWTDLDEPSKLSIRTKVQQQFVETSMARQREKEVKKEADNKTFVNTYANWLREKNPKTKKH